MKIKTKSSKVNRAWLNDHVHDPYVRQAQLEDYRSRAAYKLQEMDQTLHLTEPGQLVVDLGCAPGAWCQYLRRRFAPPQSIAVIGLDLLPMEPIEGVQFIQGDIREPAVLAQLQQALQGRSVDLVVSDMAPNLSGIASADAARVEELVELALEFAQVHLSAHGALVAKVFHGAAYDTLVRHARSLFAVVKAVKPKASRDRSAETFLVARTLKRVP